MAEDTLRKLMSGEEFNEYKPLKVVSRNDLYFEVVTHDIEDYGGWPPIVRIDKVTGKILEISYGN